jgi:hypothetical protein
MAATIIDLNGEWKNDNGPAAVITAVGSSISINMSAFHRPNASGSVVDSSDITVNFPDDTMYKGKLEVPGTIVWSIGTTWTKVLTVFDLN